jgi:hypothetical protein
MKTRNPAMEIGSLALNIGRALEEWRQTEGSANLVDALNGVAKQFGIIGGAFGVLNRVSNTFKLERYYPGTNSDCRDLAIFPYSPPSDSKIFAQYKVTKTDFSETDFSEQMHALFTFQREKQQLHPVVARRESESSTVLKVPEFFRHLFYAENAQNTAIPGD